MPQGEGDFEMAKYNNYHTHAARSSVNKGAIGIIITVLVALLMLGAAVGVMGYGTSGFKDWGFSRFVGKNPAAYEQPEGEIPEETGSAIVEPAKGNGMTMLARQATEDEARFYGIAGMSLENVFQLSVTYEPEDTTFQQTNYSIAFTNPDSAWATGKDVSNYVQLTHTDSAKEATITVLQSFSEQVTVTASNAKHSEIKATTTIDYVCEDLDFDIDGDHITDPEHDIEIKKFEWTKGTIIPEGQNFTFLIKLRSDLISFMQSKQFQVKEIVEFNLPAGFGIGDGLTSIPDALKKMGDYNSLDNRQKEFHDALAEFFKDKGDYDTAIGTYSYKIKRNYKGKNYGDIISEDWKDLYVQGLNEYYEISPQSMSTNQNSIIAG